MGEGSVVALGTPCHRGKTASKWRQGILQQELSPLIGVSLSSRKVRGGTGLHIGIGIALCFSYIMLNRVFEEFAKGGSLPPMLAVWLPNIIYAVIAIYLYRKAPK